MPDNPAHNCSGNEANQTSYVRNVFFFSFGRLGITVVTNVFFFFTSHVWDAEVSNSCASLAFAPFSFQSDRLFSTQARVLCFAFLSQAILLCRGRLLDWCVWTTVALSWVQRHEAPFLLFAAVLLLHISSGPRGFVSSSFSLLFPKRHCTSVLLLLDCSFFPLVF